MRLGCPNGVSARCFNSVKRMLDTMPVLWISALFVVGSLSGAGAQAREPCGEHRDQLISVDDVVESGHYSCPNISADVRGRVEQCYRRYKHLIQDSGRAAQASCCRSVTACRVFDPNVCRDVIAVGGHVYLYRCRTERTDCVERCRRGDGQACLPAADLNLQDVAGGAFSLRNAAGPRPLERVARAAVVTRDQGETGHDVSSNSLVAYDEVTRRCYTLPVLEPCCNCTELMFLKPKDPCEAYPCKHQGTCITTRAQQPSGRVTLDYFCQCTSHFTGPHCEEPVHKCRVYSQKDMQFIDRCAPGGRCLIHLGMPYTCVCTGAYTGHTCKECRVGFWGQGCARACNCYNMAACNQVTGACPAPGGPLQAAAHLCAFGWAGDRCDTRVHE